MPVRAEAADSGVSGPQGDPRARRDHESIARLADDVLPALIARLAASGLREIEVREGGWKARLRKPAPTGDPRRIAMVGVEAHAGSGYAAGRGAPAHGRPDDRDRHPSLEDEAAEEPGLIAAKSPAVGIYHPRQDLVVGMHVRSGDRIGYVDVLGVHQDVVSPIDGSIGSSLAEAGEAVEYGQDLVRIEQPDRAPEAEAGRPAAAPAGVAVIL